jgi:sugar-specific transcriptional regulator TrmB
MSDTFDNNQSRPLAEELTRFGLNKVEAQIYLHLVGKQPKSMLEIAQELDLPRTSIYDNAIKLAEKGLVEKVVKFKSQKLQAYPLSILQELIDKEQSRIQTLQTTLTDLEKRIAQVTAVPFSTEVRYYQGTKGFQQMMWNSLKAKEETIGYSQFGRVDVVGKQFAQKHFNEIIRRGTKDRVITNPTPEMLKYITVNPFSEERHAFQQTRIMPVDKLYISGDTTIYNNIFAVAYWQHGEVVGVEIENPELVRTQRSIFEQMWQLAEPYESYARAHAQQ